MSKAYQIILTGDQEVPPVATAASGIGVAVYDSATSTLEYTLNVTGVDYGPFLGLPPQTAGTDDDVIDAHFHTGAPGVPGPVVFDWDSHDADDFSVTLEADGSWTIRGRWETTDPNAAENNIANFAALLDGAGLGDTIDMYANVHTEANNGGEIRGQLVCFATDGDETVNGTAGKDILTGLGGNDLLIGDAGNDQLFGGDGNDIMGGGPGLDIFDGGAGIDWVSYGNAGAGFTASLADQLQNTAAAAGETYASVEGLIGSDHNDTLIGDGGQNFLRGGLGGDALDGGAGSDWAEYNNAAVGVIADLLNSAFNSNDAAGDTYTSIENLIGSDFDDVLRGDHTNNQPFGGSNILEGRGGADTLVGRGGFDYAAYRTAPAGVSASLANPGTNTGDAAGDTYTLIEGLIGSAFDDTLTGNAGNNILNGRGGADTLMGGAGLDTADYFSISGGGPVTADLQNAALNAGDAAGDSYGSIENLRGSAFDDVLRGNGAVNVLTGLGGDDMLVGRGANDVMFGGTGDDTYFAQNGGDRAIEAVGEGTDRVLASVTYKLRPGSEIELLRTNNPGAATAINLIGNEFAQTLQGNAGNNVLDGRGGNDIMQGLGGNDTYRVDSAGDKTVEGPGGGIDKVLASVSYALQAGREIEVLRTANAAAAAPLNLTGNELGQTIQGNAGANVLDGKAGNDLLQGLGGPDTFVFADGYDADRVLGYQAGIDQFNLQGVSGLDTYADLQALMNQVGAHVVINFGGGDVLRVLNTTIATLDNNQGDFLV
jgi:Ca2+-binding RTX toxin-like protein